MKRYWLLPALLFTACHRPEEPKRKPLAAASAPPPASPALAVSSKLEHDGLTVTTGTWALHGALWGFSELAPDLSRTQVEVVQAPRGAQLAQLLPERGLAVVNGGYFEADYRPSTWLIAEGVELSPKADTGKGGVLAVDRTRSYVGAFDGLKFAPDLLVQSFPLIVEPDFKSGIHSDDGRRAARTIACVVSCTLHFIVIAAPRGDGPTLFEAVGLLRQGPPDGFGCSVALNLDGGPSTGVWFAPRVQARSRTPLANVGYAIAIVPR